MILRAVVGRNPAGSRLDNAAAVLFPQLSKGRIRRIVDWGGARIEGLIGARGAGAILIVLEHTGGRRPV